MPDHLYFNARRAPQDLASGRVLAPGEQVGAGDLSLGENDQGRPTHDQNLVDSGALQRPPEPGEVQDGVLRGDALDAEAKRLGIEGRSGMSADDLRAAVSDARAAETTEETA